MLFGACQFFSPRPTENQTASAPDSLALQAMKRLPNMVRSAPDTIGPLDLDSSFAQALLQQTLYLVRPSTRDNPLRGIKREDLLKSIHALEQWKALTPAKLYESFDFYEVQTSHRAEKVRLTGYYTPVLHASRKQTANYKIPLLRRPRSWSTNVPTTDEIFAGALNGKGLEIAWCRSQKEIKNAQMQGSCVIEFPDGKHKFLGFDGTNKTLLKNMSDSVTNDVQSNFDLGAAYIFFQEQDTLAYGAAGFPVTPGYSIAVDQSVIPLGACLLARIPLRDSTGVTRYTHRIVMAQDMGASIKSTGHIDLYCGYGKSGYQMVQQIAGFGQLWLLLPKSK
jgi:membrane-bound lytic murein transglycosylase A